MIPAPATISNSSAREWSKCSHSAFETSTPCWARIVASVGTHDPHVVPARVHVFNDGTSCAPPAIAAVSAPLVTALQEQICAESGSAPASGSAPPFEISVTGSSGSADPTSGRSEP